MSGSFDRFWGDGAVQHRTHDLGEGQPIGRPRVEGLVAGAGKSVVLAGRAGIGGDQPGTDPGLPFEPGQGGVDGTFENVDEPDLVEPLHDLVAVGLPFGEKLQQEQRQDALEQLRVVSGGYGAILRLLL